MRVIFSNRLERHLRNNLALRNLDAIYCFYNNKTTMNNDESFIKLPLSLLQDTRLTLTRANIIAYRLGFKEYFASPQSVADLFGVKVNAVHVAFRMGEKYGYLPPTEKKNRKVKTTIPTNTTTIPTNTTTIPTNTQKYSYEYTKEADSPMKTDLLLDNDKIIDKKVILETKLDTDKIQQTVSVRSNDKPQSDWFDKQFDDMKKETETINYDTEVIIKFAITKLNKECSSVYNKTQQKSDYVYYKQSNSNCWIGLNSKDYNECLELYKQGHQ